jgi:hypothetical protein
MRLRRWLPWAALTLFIVACATGQRESGTLEGHVTIGPLMPVQRADVPEPTPPPEMYAQYEILIYAQDGRTEVARARIDSGGDYRVTLGVGTYMVNINRQGISRGIDLPQKVTISSQQVTRLDIQIDTGIR